MSARLALIGTGGTIASTAATAQDLTDYQVTQGIASMLAAVPGAGKLADIRCEQLCNTDSRAMRQAQVLRLARRVLQCARAGDIDGIVITHGTDTLEETAFALHLLVRTPLPVVLVGAMRPASALSADGPLNLYNALLVARDPASRDRGVLIAMDERIVAARWAHKLDTTQVAAFGGDNRGVIGSVRDGTVRYVARPEPSAAAAFDPTGLRRLPAVDIIIDYQDAPLHPYRSAIAAGTRGIIVAGVGNGNLTRAAERGCALARRHGLPCVRASRVPNGPVVAKPADEPTGLVAAQTLNPLQARIVLQLAIAGGWDTARIRQAMQEI